MRWHYGKCKHTYNTFREVERVREAERANQEKHKCIFLAKRLNISFGFSTRYVLLLFKVQRIDVPEAAAAAAASDDSHKWRTSSIVQSHVRTRPLFWTTTIERRRQKQKEALQRRVILLYY